MRLTLSGVSASRGQALGRARLREPQKLEISAQNIPEGAVEVEIERLHEALDMARAELRGMRERLHGAIAHELGEFLDLHALILDDPELLLGLDDLIRTGRYSADYALKLQRDRLASIFDGIDDPYLRSRREDLDHVIGRVYAALHRSTHGADAIAGIAGEVLITDTVAPSELAELIERGVVAVVTAQGSALSHSAILARSLHLPLIVGAHEALSQINDGDALLVDAAAGEIVIEPDARDLARYHRQRRDDQREKRSLSRLKSAPTRSVDGVDICLQANAESREDVAQAFSMGAAGVGLYRTEFLFLQRREPPDEESQFLAYRDLVLGMGGRPVTLRTLDLGADKADSAGISVRGEPNPALGVRGVRLSLAQPALFRTQLRALLRASGYGPVRLLVPMVSCGEEIRAVRMQLDACAAELRAEGLAQAPRVPLGAMIEVPAAALAVHSLARDIDFISIGTNDLIQYLLAADRGNDALDILYSPLHPAVLRLLRNLIEFGRRRRLPVSICGEIAGDARFTRLLLALGLTDFSLHPGTLLEVRQQIREADLGRLTALRPALLRANSRSSIEAMMARLQSA